MSDHTGEAWDVWDDGGDIYHIDATMEDGDTMMIAGCIEGRSRAAVMVAAPDLLAAAKAILEASSSGLAVLANAEAMVNVHLPRLRAAVAKAEAD